MNKTKIACKILKDALSKFTGKLVKQRSCYKRNEYESFVELVVDISSIDLDKMVDEMQLALEGTDRYMDILLFNDEELLDLGEKGMKRALVKFCILWYVSTGE